MKTLLFNTLLSLIGIIAPVFAQAQKYHDAAIEDAKGPVKTITEDTRTLQYSPEGKLLSVNGVVPYEEETRNDQGYLCAAKGDLYNGSFEYDNNNRLSAKRTYKLFGGGHYTYTYNSEGQCVRCDILEDGVPTIIFEYSAIRTDSHGNWIQRECTTKSLIESTGEWNIQPAKTQTRTITYYENSLATSATPAVKPRNVSIADFVRHPFALVSLGGNATYNEAKSAIVKQGWEIDDPDNTAYVTCSSNGGYNMAYQDHLPQIADSYFPDSGNIRNWSYTFYFSKNQYDYETIHALALRMKQELQQAGIPLSPIQANFLYVVEGNGIRLLIDENTNEWYIYLSIRK